MSKGFRVMFRTQILLNALCLFSSVTVYLAVIGASSHVSDQLGMAALNLFFMLSTAAGIFAFGFFRGRVPAFPPAHAQLAAFCVNAACVAALVNILNVRPGFGLRYAALFLFTFSNGYITGCLFSQISRYIPAARQGFCIGASLASAHFFLFLSDTLVAVLHIPTPHALFFLFPVLALMAYLLLHNEPEELTDINATPSPDPFLLRHAPLFLLAAVLLSLTVGFSDSLFLTRHAEFMEWHRYTRFINVGGFLLAGWLADSRPFYLPLAALLARTVSLGFCVFMLEGGAVSISSIADCFFTTFLIVFLIWAFITLSPRMPNPELWAGMGRIVELPCGAIGTMLGIFLLQRLPVSLTFLVYMALLMCSGALFYQAMLIWIRRSNRPVILATVNEPEEPKNKIYGTAWPTENYNAWETENNNAPTLTDHDVAASEFENTNAATLSDYRIAALEIENINATTLSDYYAAASEDDEDILLNTESYITDFSNLDLAEKENATQPEPEAIPSSAMANETRTQPDEVPPPALSTAFNMTPEQLDELLQKFKAFYHLTRRETEILRELLWERSIQEIAETLVITPRTVKYHISNLFQKTGATTQKTLKRILRKQKRRFDSGLDVVPSNEDDEEE
ncbi:MAG: hypothetical protein IJ522_05790 [Acidaminococcaceae bacterium]|nr:hypothetical protein [Acidaminococcaceae bacterium]